jgi:tetratricopeptide (TPR) repeat protein
MNKVDNKRNSEMEHRVSRGRIFFFKIAGILITLIILILIELSLRLFHYGNNFKLFVDFPENKDYLVLNPDASKKYFTNQEFATVGSVEPFKKNKDVRTFRIFILGESTTAGYPYFHNGSFHRWLQYRLMHEFPDKKFEVINLSLTAVNSYTVFGFAKALIHYNPDAILIYTGHNEYYGALGVASTEKIGGNPYMVNMILCLRELRLTQLLTNLYVKIAGTHTKGSGGTRMKMMVSDEQIPYDSKLYNRGINQFRSNIDKTLSLFEKYNIPVFISTLVSNEKDFKPFISIAVDSIRFPGFNKYFKDGTKAFEKNDFLAASQLLLKADKICDASALCNFYLGETTYKLGDLKQAKEYFVKAKDLDGLRFRAPEQINDIIRKLCDKYRDAYLVDTRAAYEKWSDDHIIGHELILEHLHPNLNGYALMSDAFFEKMKKTNMFPVINDNEMTFTQLVHNMPVTKVDSLAGIYTVSNLKKSWPFSDVSPQVELTVYTGEEKLAWNLAARKISWIEAMDSLFIYYIHANRQFEAMKTIEGLALEYPQNELIIEKVAMLSSNLHDNKNALFYFKRAFEMSPSFDKAKYTFAICLKLDDPVDAIPYLNYAIKNNNSGLNLPLIKTYTEDIIQLKSVYVKDSTDLAVINKIALVYLKMGNKDGASKYVNKALRLNGKNAEALTMKAQLKKMIQ